VVLPGIQSYPVTLINISYSISLQAMSLRMGLSQVAQLMKQAKPGTQGHQGPALHSVHQQAAAGHPVAPA
jgi:hypothetical protein